jgi:hypothetical protein
MGYLTAPAPREVMAVMWETAWRKPRMERVFLSGAAMTGALLREGGREGEKEGRREGGREGGRVGGPFGRDVMEVCANGKK